MIHSPFSNQSQGFTLVETLIAIAVLMIAIAGPLVVADKSLTAALYAKDQMVGTYLAQETIEMIKNTRDNNISIDPIRNWDDVFSSCTLANRCDASALSNTYVNSIVMCTQPTIGCPLYLDSNGLYGDSNTGTKSIFTRYFYLTDAHLADGSIDPAEKQLVVIVDWNERTVPNEIKITREIFDLSHVQK